MYLCTYYLVHVLRKPSFDLLSKYKWAWIILIVNVRSNNHLGYEILQCKLDFTFLENSQHPEWNITYSDNTKKRHVVWIGKIIAAEVSVAEIRLFIHPLHLYVTCVC